MRLSAVLLGLVAAVAAQTNTTACCDLDPGTVDINQRLSWCRAQQNTCPELCSNGQTSINNCDSATLKWECKCLSGNTPNVSDYMQTLPSLECDEWKAQCTKSHPNDLAGQNFCQSFTCGKKNATLNLSSGSSSGSSTTSPSATGTGAAPSSTSKSAAANMVRVGREYGTGAVLIGLTALFGLAL